MEELKFFVQLFKSAAPTGKGMRKIEIIAANMKFLNAKFDILIN